MAAKKTASAAKTPTKKFASKAAFVRANPRLTAKEIVAKANAEGIKMGEAYVYNVRTYDKSSKSKRARHAARRTAATSSFTTSAEGLLKAAAAEIGLGRALDILERERAMVKSAMGG